jgi:hypothetical protein
LASNFNNDPFNTNGSSSTGGGEPSPLSPGPATATPEHPAPAAPDTMSADVPATTSNNGVTSDNPESAAFVRFGSCRWQQPADKEAGTVAFCTHREVKPYAGTAGFDANAWCTDCQYYKLRRAPKKRERTDDYGW